MSPRIQSETAPSTISINGVEYVPKSEVPAQPKLGPEVIVRTYSAGVHIGTLEKREGREVTLANARMLWSWSGAFTLREVAMNGVDRENSRITAPVPSVLLLEAIEIIPVADGVDLSTTEKK